MNKSTQTHTPSTLNLDVIASLVKNYENKLILDYESHYLKNANSRRLGDVEIQLIYSFMYPADREITPHYRELDDCLKDDYTTSNSNHRNSFEKCLKCSRWKEKKHLTNKFCMENLDVWDDYWTRFNHTTKSICYECLNKMSSYGLDHRDENFLPKCPCCSYRHKFHYINTHDLTRSHPSRLYTINSLLNYNTTTTKKMNVSINDYVSSRGKNWEKLYEGENLKCIIVNRNSFSWKLSLLHNILTTEFRNQLLKSYDFDSVFMGLNGKKICRFITPNKTRKEIRLLFDELKQNLAVRDLTNANNGRLRYYYDEKDLVYPANTITSPIERDDRFLSIQ